MNSFTEENLLKQCKLADIYFNILYITSIALLYQNHYFNETKFNEIEIPFHTGEIRDFYLWTTIEDEKDRFIKLFNKVGQNKIVELWKNEEFLQYFKKDFWKNEFRVHEEYFDSSKL